MAVPSATCKLENRESWWCNLVESEGLRMGEGQWCEYQSESERPRIRSITALGQKIGISA